MLKKCRQKRAWFRFSTDTDSFIFHISYKKGKQLFRKIKRCKQGLVFEELIKNTNEIINVNKEKVLKK